MRSVTGGRIDAGGFAGDGIMQDDAEIVLPADKLVNGQAWSRVFASTGAESMHEA
jgi:hypothetical protein